MAPIAETLSNGKNWHVEKEDEILANLTELLTAYAVDVLDVL